MTRRDTAFAPGTPCWVDLTSLDPAASTAFYTGLFGWEAVESGADFHNYVSLHSGGQPVAGVMPKLHGLDGADAWNLHLSTDELESAAAVASEAGARVVIAPLAVGDLGRMALLVDPAGTLFGLWQAGTHTGFGKYGEAGSVTWNENHSKDFGASSSFYPTVFDWHVHALSDTDSFRYLQAYVDGEVVAGLLDAHASLPAEVPSHWVTYFGTADVDAALATVESLGGTVLRPAQDSPFGRIAEVRDPGGAVFRLHTPAPSG
jgi:predicted enzyme related to lactoylglutathione lyase